MLNPNLCADKITVAYRKAAAIGPDGKPNYSAPEGDYPVEWAKAYNAYAKLGLVLGAVNTGGDTSILEDFMRGVDGTAGSIDGFAAALAAYWSAVAITSGAPSHGGTAVISVVNDAASKESAFKSAILASITASEGKPYFSALISNIEAVVKTIVWTVTEMMPTVPPAPVPWLEVIS